MNTTENDKILAQFLGKKYKDGYVVISNDHHCTMNPSGELWDKAKYASDWKWLMQVVDKIEQTKFVDTLEINYDNIFGHSAVISPALKNTFDTFESRNGTQSKIENVYNVCVDFINWYNSYNKK